jgi:hypothetical protein
MNTLINQVALVQQKSPLLSWIIAGMPILLAVVGSLPLWYATRFTIQATPDSVVYARAAVQIAAGHGYVQADPEGQLKRVTHFPPGYSGLLAACMGDGQGGLNRSARVVALACSCLTCMTLLLLFRAAGLAPVPASIGAVVFLNSPQVINTYAHLMSEPPFMVCLIICLAALLRYSSGAHTAWLVGAVVAAGAAPFFRFVGLLLPIFVGGHLLVGGCKKTPWANVRRAVLVVVAASWPVATWMAIQSVHGGHLANRELVVHFISIDQIRVAMTEMMQWALPLVVDERIRWFVQLAMIFFTLALARSRGAPPSVLRDRANWTLIAFALAYLMFLVVSISLADNSTDLNTRILLPVFLCLGAWVWITAWSSRPLAPNTWITVYRVIVAMLALVCVVRGGRVAQVIARDGASITTREWQVSHLMKAIEGLPADVRIYANEPEAIYWHTGRLVREWPFRYDPLTRRPVSTDHASWQYWATDRTRGPVALVHFQGVFWRPHLVLWDDLVKHMPETATRLVFPDGELRVYTLLVPTGRLAVVNATSSP